MKKYRVLLVAALFAMLLTGATCNSNRTTYTTLASTERGVVSAYEGYLDAVIKGQARTNEVPVISKSFEAFQASMRTAVDAASGNTNAPISADMASAAASIINAISNAKGAR